MSVCKVARLNRPCFLGTGLAASTLGIKVLIILSGFANGTNKSVVLNLCVIPAAKLSSKLLSLSCSGLSKNSFSLSKISSGFVWTLSLSTVILSPILFKISFLESIKSCNSLFFSYSGVGSFSPFLMASTSSLSRISWISSTPWSSFIISPLPYH